VPDFSQPAAMSFIAETVLLIFIFVGIGVMAVQRAKKRIENDTKDDN
jgi:hypothetical protein